MLLILSQALVFQGSNDPGRWCRFQYHAKRVRTLNISRHDKRVTSQSYKCISDAYPEDHPLPNLRSLTNDDWDLGEELAMFVGPSLERLSLEYLDKTAVPTLLRAVLVAGAKLRTLRVPINVIREHLPVVEETLSEIIRSTSVLSSICAPVVPEAAMAHLSTLPSLDTLQFTLEDVDLSVSLPSLGFQTLRYLFLLVSSHDMNPTFSFLNVLCAPLTRVGIDLGRAYNTSSGTRMSWQPTAEDLKHLFLALLRFPALAEVYVGHEMDSFGLLDDIFFVTENHLSPLFQLRNLTRLDLGEALVRLTAATLQNMARAWPHIRDIFIGYM